MFQIWTDQIREPVKVKFAGRSDPRWHRPAEWAALQLLHSLRRRRDQVSIRFVQNRCQATDLQRKKKRTAQKINAQKNTRIMSNYFIVSWFWHRRTRLLNFSRNWSRNELWWCNQCGPVTTSTPCDSQGNEDNIRSKLNSKLPGLCGGCGERVWERRIGDQNKAKLCYCQEKAKANKEECTVPPPIPGNNFVGGSIFVEIFLNWRFVLALNETCLYCNCGPPYSGGPLFGAHSKWVTSWC